MALSLRCRSVPRNAFALEFLALDGSWVLAHLAYRKYATANMRLYSNIGWVHILDIHAFTRVSDTSAAVLTAFGGTTNTAPSARSRPANNATKGEGRRTT